MSAIGGPNLSEDGLVFYYDTFNQLKSYRGEPTVNYITTMAANLGGNVSLSYPNNVYICTAQETNVIDPNAPGGQYSRFTGNTDSDNNQLFTSFADGSVNARNTTVAYSVYLKGTGTCHLTVYSDIAGYSTTPTINLTGEWTRYSIVQAVGNYTTHAWSAVRGILTSTNVYVAAQQVEFKSHVTPFINGTRSATQGLLDLTGNSTIDLTDVSFDSNAQMTFDGTDDTVALGDSSQFNITDSMSVFAWIKPDSVDYWKGIFGGSISGFVHFQLYYGGINVYVYGPAAAYGNPDSVSIGTNVWTNVGFTFGGNTLKVYLNGEQLPTTVTGNGANISSNSDVRFGWAYATSRLFQGRINALEVYNRNLTPTEVKENFNGIKSRYGI